MHDSKTGAPASAAPETVPFANAHLAWMVLANNLPDVVVVRWTNVVATLKLFFGHTETAHLQGAAPDLLAACASAADLLVGVADEEERVGKHNAAINVRKVERELAAAIAKARGGA